jgi:CDP-diacylglycerol--glycerol-3-phosphate 3-phosphatidyltransferase
MKFKRQIPNAISIFRLVTCFSLLGITQIPDRFAMRLAYTIVYCFVGFTDVIDGVIARKFHLESEFGAKIDNIADTCVFAVGFISLLFLLRLYPSARSTLLLALGVVLKVFSFALTKIRFGEWNTMHTYSNKALGCILFLSVPLCVWMGEINFWAVVAVVGCIALTVAEDTCILLTSKEYNVNHKGLLFEKKAK